MKDSLNNNYNKKEKEIVKDEKPVVKDEKPALKDEKPAVKDEKPAVKAQSSDEVQETKDEKVNGKKTKDEQEAVDEENEEVNIKRTTGFDAPWNFWKTLLDFYFSPGNSLESLGISKWPLENETCVRYLED